MSNDFRLIQANNQDNSNILASMHHLRCRVFHHELQWKQGLNIIGDMEFDEYDLPDTHYIVHLDDDGQVDATCRLIPTTRPYMIADHYPEFIDAMPLPHSDDVWELSRFCASEQARKASKNRITGQLIAAAIEFGLARNIKNYIALATDTIVPVIRRIAGWDPKTLGERKQTPEDFAYSVLYTVSPDMLAAVRKKNNINGFLLFDIPTDPSALTGDLMAFTPHFTHIPQQLKNKPSNHLEEMEATISYLESIAFSHGYETILGGLKLTRLVLQYDKHKSDETPPSKEEALKSFDETYARLRAHLAGEHHAG